MIWILITAFGGMCCGSFGFGMKFTTKWNWENTWSMWSLWALLVIPWAIGFLTVPHLLQAYGQVSRGTLFLVFLFGFIWGLGTICYGLGLDYLGLALANSLMLGLTLAVGSLLPLFTMHPRDILKPKGLAIIGGVAVIITGIILNAYSAVRKEKDLADSAVEDKPTKKKSFLKGLIICVIAGLSIPMLNYAFIYGEPLRASAEKLLLAAQKGPVASKALAANSIWAIALFGGFCTNIIYCLWLVSRNKVWAKYRSKETGIYYLITFIMAGVWLGGLALFGMATANMGKLGPSIGWAIINAMAIFSGNVLGLLGGEWKGVSKKTLCVMTAGLVCLLAGTGIVGYAKLLQGA